MAAGLKNLAGLVESQMKAEESFVEYFSYDLSTQRWATPCVVEISSTLGPEICLTGQIRGNRGSVFTGDGDLGGDPRF